MGTKVIGAASGAKIPSGLVVKLDDPNPRRASIMVTNRSTNDMELTYSQDALYGVTVRAGMQILLETEGVVSGDSPIYLRGSAGDTFTAVVGYFGNGTF